MQLAAIRSVSVIVLYVCMFRIIPISKSSQTFTGNMSRSRSTVRRNDLELPPVVSWTICKTLPGLTKSQQSLCRKYTDVTLIAIQGLEMALQECQYQFRNHRWNCSSSFTAKINNPHNNVWLKRGIRETAFSNAISAAGVTHSVAKACSMGKLMACGCEPTNSILKEDITPQERYQKVSRNRWKWGGCSHNMDFGIYFSTLFLDAKEKQANSIQSSINLHNYQAGRLAVSTQMQVRCKCHGMSGSCQLKTCWRSAPEFRVVGDALKERFRNAVLVNQSNLGNGSPLLVEMGAGSRKRRSRYNKSRKRKRKVKQVKSKDLSRDLLYYQKSPSFCEKDASVDFPGTVGRICNRTSRGMDNCSSLCCGRGYNIVKQKKIERCNCRFEWCCYVICQNCTINEWITVCK